MATKKAAPVDAAPETLEGEDGKLATPGDDTKPPPTEPDVTAGPVASGSVRCKVGPGCFVQDGKWHAEGSIVDVSAADLVSCGHALTPV
jgi:hypothetical protein